MTRHTDKNADTEKKNYAKIQQRNTREKEKIQVKA